MLKAIIISNIHSPSTGGGVFTSIICKLMNKLTPVKIYYCRSDNIFMRIINLFVGYFIKKFPLKVAYYYNPKIAGVVTKVNNDDDTLIIIDHLEAAWVLRFLNTDKKVYYVSHNDEAHLFRDRFFIDKPNFFYKALNYFFAKESDRINEFQNDVVSRVRGVISISSEQFLLHSKKHVILPPGFSYTPYWNDFSESNTKKQSDKLKICFLGNINWWPNIRGLDWFIKHVFPCVSPVCELYLFGKGFEKSENNAKYKHIHGIHCMGFAEQLDMVWSQADVLIVPIFQGSGVNVKLAEIIYNRIPVITTSFALTPLLGCPQEKHGVWVADDKDEWINTINAIYEMEKIPRINASLSDLFSENSQELLFNKFMDESL